MYSDLINFTHLDSSNNNGRWGTREEIEFVVRRIETEIRGEIQRWREEMGRRKMELRNELMRMQIENTAVKRGYREELSEIRRENRKMNIISFFSNFFYVVIY